MGKEHISEGGVPPFEGMMMEYDAATGRKEKEAKKAEFLKEKNKDAEFAEMGDAEKAKLVQEAMEKKSWHNPEVHARYKATTVDYKRQKSTKKGGQPASPRDIDGAAKAADEYEQLFEREDN